MMLAARANVIAFAFLGGVSSWVFGQSSSGAQGRQERVPPEQLVREYAMGTNKRALEVLLSNCPDPHKKARLGGPRLERFRSKVLRKVITLSACTRKYATRQDRLIPEFSQWLPVFDPNSQGYARTLVQCPQAARDLRER